MVEALRITPALFGTKKNLVEYGATITIKFVLEALENGTWQKVNADTLEAYLETTEKPPAQITSLPVGSLGVGEYYVNFYADPDTVSMFGKYYVSLYVTYGGIEKAERFLVVVVQDVR